MISYQKQISPHFRAGIFVLARLKGRRRFSSFASPPPRILCSDQNAENNSPNCFLYAFYPLRVRVPLISYQKQISPHFRAGIFVLARLKGRRRFSSFASPPPRILCSDQNAENNSPNCFLYAFYPLRVRVPLISYPKQISPHFRAGIFVLARLKGLEPPTYWFVASHSIQLSYKRIFGFAVSIQPIYNITVFIEMQGVNCKFFVTVRRFHTVPSAFCGRRNIFRFR